MRISLSCNNRPRLADIAASHAAGRFAALSIDHQSFLQRSCMGAIAQAGFAYGDYNNEHARTLKMLRHYNVPIVHIAYDIFSPTVMHSYTPETHAEMKTYTKPFLYNQEDLTIRNPGPENTSHGTLLKVDLMSDVQDDDILSFKEGFGAHENPELGRVLQARGIDTLATFGIFREECVLTSLHQGHKRKYRSVVFGNATESACPVLDVGRRLDNNRAFFSSEARYALVTTREELGKAFEKAGLHPS